MPILFCYSTFRRRLGLLVLIFAAHSACASDWDNLYYGAFPVSDWDRREGLLLEGPSGSFDYELGRLLPAAPVGQIEQAQETFNYDTSAHCPYGCELRQPQAANEQAQNADLDQQQRLTLATMRLQADAATAYAVGSGLPEDVRRYAAGALAFAHDRIPDALNYFRQVLDLPAAARHRRGLTAQYMLGRCYARAGDVAAATTAFQHTRTAVATVPDPLGLAVASFGEEARLHVVTHDYIGAAHLYAAQAARGSRSARDSLKWMARSLYLGFDDQPLRAAIEADELATRLVTAYVFSNQRLLDAGKMRLYLTEMAASPTAGRDDKDRLAAVAYRVEDFKLAAALLADADGPLASWLRAKLALRAGDMAAARRHYLHARQGFSLDEDWGGNDGYLVAQARREIFHFKPAEHVARELALLELKEGHYDAALAQVYRSIGNYPDTAYIAERVSTLDELKSFVDAHAPPETLPLHREWMEIDRPRDEPALPVYLLRNLLGRRLLRAHRGAEALAYFTDPTIAAKAQAYAQALDDAAGKADPILRAQAWFRAGTIARQDGMAILATELYPDDRQWGNSVSEFPFDDARAKTLHYLTPDELARVAASHLDYPRLHYRYLAVAHAEQAAGLLPPRSQAFAAVLCAASGWVLPRDPDTAQRLYQRYVQNGALRAGSRDFGRNCVEPDFIRAAEAAPGFSPLIVARHLLGMHRLLASAMFSLLALLILLLVARRWRKARDVIVHHP